MVIYAPQFNNAQAMTQNSMYNVGYNASYNNNIGAYNNNMTSVFNNNNYYQNYNTYNNIALPANNTTNIFNNYMVQPSVMTPQASPQIVIAVPTATAQQQPVQANTPSSNETAMKFMLLMMTMLLGKTNKADKTDKTEKTNKTGDIKEGKIVVESDDTEMNAAKAAKILLQNFDAIEKHYGNNDGKAIDDVLAWDEFTGYYSYTSDENYKKAYEYFRDNKDKYDYIETLGGNYNKDWANKDAKVCKDELKSYIGENVEFE